ncbi:TspO/MBR family protein [Tropicimonas sp. TH_r6]|uniref:tryptophan-rich sensory protein TspO n=1 Tax=Tropicimonas sp. TH_r6 TaxID=3082085 RepID=UPI0029547BB3|nr:TspO/MBR family protein [Tropicimonas sp. TH_r6]MDV7144264.1 TspO/MBR family protein [Tropicimonas sp. TH_r6]
MPLTEEWEFMTFILFLVFLATCVAAGSTGALFAPGTWYRDLRKPAWTPPGWVFSVAWTSLYLLMSWAAARVAVVEGSGLALALWALQIALNTLWTPVFFGLHQMRTGLVVISLLWVSAAAAMLAFFQVDTLAGALLIPYVGWVSIALCLNVSILRLNPEQGADPN